MKQKVFMRVLASILCLSLLLSACHSEQKGAGESSGVSSGPAVSSVSSQPASGASAPEDAEKMTLGKAADYLLSAAAKYNKDLPSREALMENPDGLQEDSVLTRLQALVMVSRAFGELPEPVGNQARTAPQEADLSAAPEWAQEALESLHRGGALDQNDLGGSGETKAPAGAEEGMEAPETELAEAGDDGDGAESGPAGEAGSEETAGSADSGDGSGSGEASVKSLNDEMTGKDVKVLAARMFALFGTERKDDFYTAVNKNALDTKEIPAGETDAGGTYDQRIAVQEQVNAIIKEIVEGDGYEPGSMEEKIKKYFESASDFARRNELGAEPLRKYLEAIDRASNFQELTDAQVLSLKELGAGGLVQLAYMTDVRDTQKYAALMMPPVDPYMAGDPEMDKLNIRFLVLCGESEEGAAAQVKAVNELYEAMEPYSPAPEDYADTEKINRFVSVEEAQKFLPGIDLKALITAAGDEVPEEINLQSPTLFEGFQSLMEENGEQYLPALKTMLKLGLVNVFYTDLSQDFMDAMNEYNEKTMGETPSDSTPEEIGYALVSANLGDYIDRIYAQRHFSPEAKQDVENMVKQFIEVYKSRVQNLSWMGEETKKAAIEKLDSMKFFIGYPDSWSDMLDGLEVTDSFFQNQVAISKLAQQRNREEAAAKNRGELKNDMKIPVATVNAYYDQFTNTMCFPAGILQAPAYDVNASLEENLGGIGTTIAHEISHAFDNNGAKYDKNGMQTDWWTQEDYAKFQELCDRAEGFYDGWESAPGIAISGKQTLGENIADIGGVACALEVLKKSEHPDYDKFFRAYAEGWLKCTTRARAESLAEVDEHSPSNLRVNRVLANFQEFYDTYGVQEGDGMYVPPAQRIEIW